MHAFFPVPTRNRTRRRRTRDGRPEATRVLRSSDANKSQHALDAPSEPSSAGDVAPLDARGKQLLWSSVEIGSPQGIIDAINGSVLDTIPPADVNSTFLFNRTALHQAASRGDVACVETLLSLKATIDRRTTSGLTALYLASQNGHFNVARLLVESNADFWCETDDGTLPIHVAASMGHAAVVTLLIGRDRGLLYARNQIKQRPKDVASSVNIVQLLQAAEDETASVNDSLHGDQKEEHVDAYACRTNFKGSVVLRNSRRDVVRRLLQRSQQCEASFTASVAQPSPDNHQGPQPIFAKARPTAGICSRLGPFATLHPEHSRFWSTEVGPESFEMVRFLGKGNFGDVHQVMHKASKREFAMKLVEKSRLRWRSGLWKEVQAEHSVLSFISHPYIVDLQVAFQTKGFLVMVFELCSGGNLDMLIQRQRRLQVPLARFYAAEILLAIGHLHERNLAFRSLKPSSIVIDNDGHCKLAAFGLIKAGVKALTGANSFCGHVAFLAPEQVLRRVYGLAVDLYGLGALLFAMIVGFPPFFHTDQQTLLANIKCAPLQVPRWVSADTKSIIFDLMERDPSHRLGVGDTPAVQRHVFFKGIDFAALARRELPVPECCLDIESAFHATNHEPPDSSFSKWDRKAHSPNLNDGEFKLGNLEVERVDKWYIAKVDFGVIPEETAASRRSRSNTNLKKLPSMMSSQNELQQ
eukprot:TRINITY_DN19892_c0_g1_i1.p1 TRINITY_DN19892_c0_g1~~TRINITY_DN19892_c0_g1_i1.p1  ORF type:complete len:697 (+),score=100.00 TRINITY_DN19892_c0_g1_i1:104-2194(+)